WTAGGPPADYGTRRARLPTGTPTGTPTPPNTTCKPAWSSTAVYTAGNEVSYSNHNWKAKWWTQNEQPAATEWGPWQDEGAC
ncbi:carbohydrate-binding protein, partial [Streptomyces sp. NPDC127133]|uniref:carbohydrate-binding protein n=1 Tax=Streptomyces sp. NPDC127133 TaxID=3345375 RepID=UPI003625AC71